MSGLLTVPPSQLPMNFESIEPIVIRRGMGLDGQSLADHNEATAADTLTDWARPARAEAARCAKSSTLRPIALRACASGLITTDRMLDPSEASWLPIRPLRRSANVTGARTTTRSQPAARSAFVIDRTPPST